MAYTLNETRDEMRDYIRTLVALSPESNRETALRAAANALRLPYHRIKKYFYLEASQVPAHEADKIRAYVKAAQKLIEAREQYESTRRAFLAESDPVLARLAPPPVGGKTAAACREASAVVARRTLTKAARSSDGCDE